MGFAEYHISRCYLVIPSTLVNRLNETELIVFKFCRLFLFPKDPFYQIIFGLVARKSYFVCFRYQVWYLAVSIPDLCTLSFFNRKRRQGSILQPFVRNCESLGDNCTPTHSQSI